MFRKVSVADPDPFGMDPDNAFKFYTDPDPLSFQRGYVLLKQLFLYIFTLFSLSIGPTGPVFRIRIGSIRIRIRIPDPGSGSRIQDPGIVKFIEKIIFSFYRKKITFPPCC
jgi:hypothetical protein